MIRPGSDIDPSSVRKRALEQFRWYAGEAELADQAAKLPDEHFTDEEILLLHLDRHVANEEEVISSYAQFARSEPNFVRYLVNLITEDEERHHRILREVLNRVVSDMEFRETGLSVPSIDFRGTDRERLVEETARFLDLEREDLASLKELAKVLRRQRRGGLIPLLVEVMELDTKKHITILKFIAQSTPAH